MSLVMKLAKTSVRKVMAILSCTMELEIVLMYVETHRAISRYRSSICDVYMDLSVVSELPSSRGWEILSSKTPITKGSMEVTREDTKRLTIPTEKSFHSLRAQVRSFLQTGQENVFFCSLVLASPLLNLSLWTGETLEERDSSPSDWEKSVSVLFNLSLLLLGIVISIPFSYTIRTLLFIIIIDPGSQSSITWMFITPDQSTDPNAANHLQGDILTIHLTQSVLTLTKPLPRLFRSSSSSVGMCSPWVSGTGFFELERSLQSCRRLNLSSRKDVKELDIKVQLANVENTGNIFGFCSGPISIQVLLLRLKQELLTGLVFRNGSKQLVSIFQRQSCSIQVRVILFFLLALASILLSLLFSLSAWALLKCLLLSWIKIKIWSKAVSALLGVLSFFSKMACSFWNSCMVSLLGLGCLRAGSSILGVLPHALVFLADFIIVEIKCSFVNSVPSIGHLSILVSQLTSWYNKSPGLVQILLNCNKQITTTMGIRLSKNVPMNTLRLDDYDAIHPHNSPVDPSFKVLKNRLTGNELEEYFIVFADSAEYQDYYDAYYWRLSQDHVVRTLHFVDYTKTEFCSTSYSAKLYTERIPIKLSDIKDIPYPDNLYVLLASLDGFDRIVEKAGYFEIQEYMICVNRQGEVKVWINDNLSRNYPDSMRNRRDGSEEEMVRRLISIIDQNTDTQSQPTPLPAYIYSQVDNPSFGDAMLLVREYARQHRTDIPTNFQCILEVLNDSRYPEDSRRDHSVISQSRISKSIVRSSIPMQNYNLVTHNPVVPNFSQGLATRQANPGIPEFSRISNIAAQPSFRQHQHSTERRMPMIQERVTRQVSTSPSPFAGVPPPLSRPVVYSPRTKVQMPGPRNVVSQRSVVPQRILQHHNNQSNSLQRNRVVSIPKPAFRQEVVTPPAPRQLAHPSPLEARRIIKVQHEPPSGRANSFSEVFNPSSKYIQQSYTNPIHQQSATRVKEQVAVSQQPRLQPNLHLLQRSVSPKDSNNEFINPFMQEQQFQPEFEYYQDLPIETVKQRTQIHLNLRTAQDIRNEQQLQQIKKHKVQLLKETKQVLNRMALQSAQYQSNPRSAQYIYHEEEQGYLQQQRYPKFQEIKTEKVSSKRIDLGLGNSGSSGIRALVYHSPEDFHQIDAEIARDLLALRQ